MAAGVVVIAAMGNELDEGNPTEYPAAIPEVCAVGATDELDKRAGFSNTGRHIDLMAPGVGILSTTPTFRYDGDGEIEYDSWDGTSMATPHVAGVAALVLAKSPGLTPAQVIRKLTRPPTAWPERRKGARHMARAGSIARGSPLTRGRMKWTAARSRSTGDAVKLIVKVDPTRSKDPAKHVSQVLRGAAAKGDLVEEVFPGLRSGSSAGLVSVKLDDKCDAKTQRAAVKALRDDEAISYVDTPKTRRPL